MGNLSAGKQDDFNEVVIDGERVEGEEEESEEEGEESTVLYRNSNAVTLPMVQRTAESVPIMTILKITEYVCISLERPLFVYDVLKWYGYFKRDSTRTLHLIFSSFYIVHKEVLLNHIPYIRVRNLFFENSVLVNSKYLSECRDLRSLINVKSNPRTLPSLKNCYSLLESLDFKAYSITNETFGYLNELKNLRHLKINFRKKILNRKDIQICLTQPKLELLEIWNTSTFQYILLPKIFYNSFFIMSNLKAMCLVRVKVSEKNLGKILSCTSLLELEYLGKLKNTHFGLFLKSDRLKVLNLAGSELDDNYGVLFHLQNVEELNLSGCICDQERLGKASFNECNSLRKLNLNGLKVTMSVIEQLCLLTGIRELHFEGCVIQKSHLELIRKNCRWVEDVDIYLDLEEKDDDFKKELEGIKKDRKKVHIYQGQSLKV